MGIPTEDDRRHYVAWSDLSKDDFSEGYWTDLYGWYEADGKASVAAFLATHDLSGFNPKAPPPKTDAFWDIVHASVTPEDAQIADLIDGLECPDVLTLANLRFEAGENPIGLWLDDHRNNRTIGHRLDFSAAM